MRMRFADHEKNEDEPAATRYERPPAAGRFASHQLQYQCLLHTRQGLTSHPNAAIGRTAWRSLRHLIAISSWLPFKNTDSCFWPCSTNLSMVSRDEGPRSM